MPFIELCEILSQYELNIYEKFLDGRPTIRSRVCWETVYVWHRRRGI